MLNPYGFGNAFADAADIETPEDVERFIGGGQVAWHVFNTEHQSLQFTALGGSDLADQSDRLYSPPQLQIEEHKALDGTVTDLAGNINYLNWALNLVHHYTAGRFIDATTSIGWMRDQRTESNPYQVGQGLPSGISTPTAGDVQIEFDFRDASRTMSFYGQEQFLTLDQHLTLSAGVTAQRTTDNGLINAYYTYPKYAAAYRLPQFVGFINELKLRIAEGLSGTDPNYGVRYTGNNNLILDHDAGAPAVFTPLLAGDPTIRPETNAEIETGFDATMFKSRAQFSFTVYQKRISNLLLQAGLAPSSGENAEWINGGQFTNRGAEISLAVTALQMHNGLTWVSTGTFARNYSVMDYLPVPGFPAGDQFGGPFGTYFIEQGKPVGWVVNSSVTNAAGVPEGVGNSQPDFTASWGNEFNLQRFHVYGLFDWVKGGTVSDLTTQYFDFGPGLLADTAASAARVASLEAGGVPYVFPGSYLKLREVTVSYDLPEEWVARVPSLHVTSARLQLVRAKPARCGTRTTPGSTPRSATSGTSRWPVARKSRRIRPREASSSHSTWGCSHDRYDSCRRERRLDRPVATCRGLAVGVCTHRRHAHALLACSDPAVPNYNRPASTQQRSGSATRNGSVLGHCAGRRAKRSAMCLRTCKRCRPSAAMPATSPTLTADI